MAHFKKIIVSGADGFIGSHLTRKLVHSKYRIAVLRLKGSDISRIRDLRNSVSVYETDLRETKQVLRAIGHFKPEVVYHLATYYKMEHTPEEIAEMTDTNVRGTLNLLEAASRFGVKVFVNTSSCFVYRDSKDKVKENAQTVPINLYALTKMQAEQSCTFYAQRRGLPVVTLRLFPPYGPADHDRRLIPYAAKCLLENKALRLTSGTQKWDYTYVADIINAFMKICDMPYVPDGHEVFNIGTGRAFSMRDIILELKRLVRSKARLEWGAIPHRENDPMFICADIGKARKYLKWQPRVNILGEGLRKTLLWYKNAYSTEES